MPAACSGCKKTARVARHVCCSALGWWSRCHTCAQREQTTHIRVYTHVHSHTRTRTRTHTHTHTHATCLSQKKAWVDTDIAVEWAGRTLKNFVKDANEEARAAGFEADKFEYLLSCDNLSAQCHARFKQECLKSGVLPWFLPPGACVVEVPAACSVCSTTCSKPRVLQRHTVFIRSWTPM